MSAPNFTQKADGIVSTLEAAANNVKQSWTDKQGNHFDIHHSQPIIKDLRDLSTYIQSPIDKIDDYLTKLKSL